MWVGRVSVAVFFCVANPAVSSCQTSAVPTSLMDIAKSHFGSTTAAHANLATGILTGFASVANVENLAGGTGNDILAGSDVEHVVSGRQGDFIVCGLAGNDVLSGNNGRDFLIGGTGSDSVHGNDTEDVLIGGTTV